MPVAAIPGREGHRPGAARRLREELGFSTGLEEIFYFTYRSEFGNGLTEFEFDHVFAGVYDEAVQPNKEEVSDHCFRPMEEIRDDLAACPGKYTTWFHLAFPRVQEWMASRVSNGLPAIDVKSVLTAGAIRKD